MSLTMIVAPNLRTILGAYCNVSDELAESLETLYEIAYPV